MATYSSGVSVAFGGTSFAEVIDLAVSYGGSIPKGRDSAWTDDVGSVTLTCLSPTGVNSANYGTRGDLVMSGGGISLTNKAVYEGVNIAPEVNGVTRYTVTFRLLDG